MNKTVTVTDENGNKHEISALADEMLTEMYLRVKKAERKRDEARAERDDARDRIRELEWTSRQQAVAYRRLQTLLDVAIAERDKWRERALLARREYHDAKGHAEAWKRSYARTLEERNEARAERETLNSRLQKLHGVFNTVWRFFDALYGASNGEPIPYLELSEEKQQLADEALDSVSYWLYGEPTDEWLHEEAPNDQ